MESKNYIIHLSCIRSNQIGKISAYLLLFLMSTSFALENQLLFESDIMELVETSERELDPKEKKLIFETSFSIISNNLAENIKSLLRYYVLTPTGIYLETLTRPPRFA